MRLYQVTTKQIGDGAQAVTIIHDLDAANYYMQSLYNDCESLASAKLECLEISYPTKIYKAVCVLKEIDFNARKAEFERAAENTCSITMNPFYNRKPHKDERDYTIANLEMKIKELENKLK